MAATILHHSRHHVVFDPPLCDPRHQAVMSPAVETTPRFESLTEDQIALLDAVDVIERLADRLGSYRRVQSVLKTVAMIHGEAL